MKLVVLKEPDVIDGVAREAGELVWVPEGYSGEARVVCGDHRTIGRTATEKVATLRKRLREREKANKPEKPEKPEKKERAKP